MLARTKGRVQHRGHIWARGAVVEVSEAELAERPDCFAVVEADEEKNEPTKTPAPLSKAQLQAKLDQLGVAYRARDTVEQLQAKLNDAVDSHPLSMNAE